MFVFTLASVAYAEVDNTVNVPFDFSSRLCTPIIEDEGLETEQVVKYICEWDPFANQPVKSETSIKEDILELEIEAEPEVKDIVISELKEEISELQKRFIKDLEVFEQRGTNSNADKEYFALLKELATCQRGTQEASGVQTKSRFAVSTTWVNSSEEYLVSLEYTGSFATLKKAIEECKAQKTILEPITLGPEYLNRAMAQKPHVYHADMALAEAFDYGNMIDITEEMFDRTQQTASRTLCDIATTAKLDYCIKDIPKANSDDTVKYVSSAYHKYQEYLNKEHFVNVSVRANNSEAWSIGSFIVQQGGYENAIDAIKWKQHFDETNSERMNKQWDE